MKKNAALFAMLATLVGCSAVMEPKYVETSSKVENAPRSHRTFTFIKAHPAQPPPRLEEFAEKLAVEMRNASMLTAMDKATQADGSTKKDSLVVTPLNGQSTLLIYYARVVTSGLLATHVENGATAKGTCDISIADAGDKFIVTITSPNEMLISTRHPENVAAVDTPFPANDIGADIARMLKNSFNAAPLSLQREQIVTGNFDAPYAVDAVYASFSRILGKRPGNDSKDARVNPQDFLLNDGSRVHLEVVPYRNGSKIMYTIQYNYRVMSDGTSTYNVANIEAFKGSIFKAAFD